MTDMELVIKIPKDVKNRLVFGVTYEKDIRLLCGAIASGTLLPKGHGRLIDADSITFSQFFDAGDYAQARRGIYEAPTIIETDKENIEVDWKTISILSELRSQCNLFDEDEHKYYEALSKAIKNLKGETLEQKPQTDILEKIRNELLSMECMEEAVEVVDKYRLEIPFDGRDKE